jgi:predicted transposase YbfD/YdcC
MALTRILDKKKVFFGILLSLQQRKPEKTMTDYNQIGPNQEIDISGLTYDLKSLFAFLLQVKDIRHAKGKIYSLVTLLVLILMAKLGGEDTPTGIADWVSNRVDQLVEMKILPKAKAPCHMTYRRVLQSIVTPEELERLISQFHQSQLPKGDEATYSMDGKTVRGTIPGGETRGTHLLSLYAPEQGLVLVEAEVDRKENEIVVAPTILKQVSLSGVTIIGDAMHTQRTTSEQILQAGGNYIWIVKGNQARTEWAIQKLFMHEACNVQKGAPLSKEIRVASQVNKGHGRREKRTIWVSSELNDYLDWPGVKQVFRLERDIWHEKHQGSTREVVYGMTGLSPQQASPKKLLRLVRQYWGIENGLHYRRDVTLHEDETRLTVGQSGHIMAILNNIVIGLCFRHGHHNLAKARRLFNSKPTEALQLILGT